jgi:hypothetical protein
MAATKYKPLPALARLLELFDYDPDTGQFIRKTAIAGLKAGQSAGHKDKFGYTYIKIDGETYKAHRLAWLLIYGSPPDGDVDHINGCTSDNRAANLRAATPKQNQENVRRRKDNSSGYRGVSFNKRVGAFIARVQHYGKRIHLGYFESPEDARDAAANARSKLFTHDHGRAA